MFVTVPGATVWFRYDTVYLGGYSDEDIVLPDVAASAARPPSPGVVTDESAPELHIAGPGLDVRLSREGMRQCLNFSARTLVAIGLAHYSLPLGVVTEILVIAHQTGLHRVVWDCFGNAVRDRSLTAGTRRAFSRFIDLFRVNMDGGEYRRFRDEFVWVEQSAYTNRAGKPTLHAHPNAANARCQATTSIDKFIERSLRRPRYDVATSRREVKFRPRGERLLYDAADLAQNFKYDRMKYEDVVSMIDVDFHVDEWSRYANHIVLMYTRIPNALAGDTTDGFYYLDLDERGKVELVECIAGGSVWRSGLWDYSRDRFIVRGAWGLSFTVLSVEKTAQPGHDGRFVIGIFPTARIWLPLPVFKWLGWASGSEVEMNLPEIGKAANVKPSRAGKLGNTPMLMGRFVNDRTDVVSVRYADAKDGSSTTIPTTLYIALANEYADPKVCVNAGVENRLESVLRDRLEPEYRAAYNKGNVLIWHDFFLGDRPRPGGLMRTPNYCFPGSSAFETGKPIAEQKVPAIVENIQVAPTVDSRNNDERCVEKRITTVANSHPFNRSTRRHAAEFVRLVVGKDKGKLKPLDMMDVVEHQQRPTQRARNTIYLRDGKSKKPSKVKGFQKREGYSNANDPRNISTVPTQDTVELGRYVYVVKSALGKHKWFMPCRKPADTTQLIHDFCRDRDVVIETDYSRFDGTISPDLREHVERAVMMGFFQEQFHGELANLLDRDQQLPAVTSRGVRYHTGASRLSGSQMTTVGNSLVNAFVAYLGLRYAHHRPEQAFGLIGPKFGDDGIDDVTCNIEKAAQATGLTVKKDTRDTRNWVSFCGRVYLRPRTHQSSIFSPKKALMSLPMTVKHDKDAHPAKLAGYLTVDPHMPLIPNYIRAVARCMGYRLEADFSKLLANDHDLSRALEGPYPYNPDADRPHALAVISELLGVDVPQIIDWEQRLDRARTTRDVEAIYKLPNAVDDKPGVRFIRPEEAEQASDRLEIGRPRRDRGGRRQAPVKRELRSRNNNTSSK